MKQTVESMAYVVSVKTDEFLNGKREVEQGAAAMRNNLRRTSNESSQAISGLTGTIQGFGQAGRSAFNGVQLGAAKFLGVALTLEGARRMFASTTTDLVRLGNVSGFLGISARSLEGFERAARAVGVSSQSMGSSLARVKNAQLWARTGMGAPDESTVAIQQLQGETGVNIIGASDPKQGLLRQAEALRQLNRDRAQVYWQRMGGNDEMFNLMYSGNLNTLQKDFEDRSNATPAAVKQAMDITKTLEQLKGTAQSVAQEFVRLFGKDINEAMAEFGRWIEENKDNILGFFRDGAKWARDFADAMNGSSNALHSFFQITDNFNLLTGFNKPLINLAGPEGAQPGQQLTARGNLDANSGLGIVWDYVAGAWKQKESRKRTYNSGGSTPPSALTPGATNPEAAMPQTQQGPDWFSSFLSSIGIGNAGAASMTPTLRRGMSMNRGASDSLLDALMMTESGGNPLAYNKRSGAAGAYQFMPGTAREMGLQVGGGVDERLDPEKSRAAANSYLSSLIKRYNGNVDYALKAYNWGMGNMDSWLRTGRGVNGQDMPEETRQYSGRVANYYRQMTNGALRPAGMNSVSEGGVQQTTHIGTVTVNSNPTTVDQLNDSIQQQANRSRMTVSFAGGVNPS